MSAAFVGGGHMQRNFFSPAGFVISLCLMAASIQSAALPMPEFQTQSQAETFYGTILRNGDNFVLSDSATKSKYMLDNPKMASRYEGITVKVTGTLNMASNLIHVQAIQPIV
jgi:uncharacterized protein DUF5818